MYRDDRQRLRDMLDAAQKAQSFIAGRTRAELDTNEMLALALRKCIEILGEAAAQTTPVYRQAHPELPWASVIGMRNRLIHGYFVVDLDIVWAVVTGDLPPLVIRLEQLLAAEQPES